MSFLKLFSGPTPDKLEQKGDALFAAEKWGDAKQAHDHAFQKLEKQADRDTADINRILEKIRNTREALAHQHRMTAENYLEGGHVQEAREYLQLAIEISEDARFQKTVQDQIHTLDVKRQPVIDFAETDLIDDPEPIHEPEADISDDDYF